MPRTLTYPLMISSCENKAPRATGGDIHGAGPRDKAQPLGFSDAAWTDPSTDTVPVLNHEAVVGGFIRAHDVRGGKAPDMQIII